MRIDKSHKVESLPSTPPWDNRELRNRLQGQEVEHPRLAELQSHIRARVDGPNERMASRKRSGRHRKKRTRSR